MAKVLLINGSPKKSGNTFIALSEVAKTLNEQGIETEIVHIGTRPIRHCIACNKCQENQNGKCVFDDDLANALSAKAADFDGYVIGSPVYYGQPNGGLMSLVQRMLYSNNAAFAGKPVANIAICRRGGATAAYQTMNMPWMMVNCPIVTSQYWNVAYGLMPGDAAYDGEGMQTMRTLARNLAHIVKSFDGKVAEQPEPWIPTHFIREDLKR